MSIDTKKLNQQLQLITDETVISSDCIFASPKHHYEKNYAHKDLTWFATDHPDRANIEYLPSSPISYKFNSSGYRCEEIQKSELLFLGCSYTFGVGLPLEDIWAHQVSKSVATSYQNFAFPGGSPGYMSRTLAKTIGLVKPQKIIALIPYNYRFEFISSDHEGLIKVWSKSGTPSKIYDGQDRERIYSYEIYTTKEDEEFRLLNDVFHMNTLAQAFGAEFIWSTWEYDEEPTSSFQKTRHDNCFGTYIETDIFHRHTRYKNLRDKARDSTHPGARFHKDFANLVKKYV